MEASKLIIVRTTNLTDFNNMIVNYGKDNKTALIFNNEEPLKIFFGIRGKNYNIGKYMAAAVKTLLLRNSIYAAEQNNDIKIYGKRVAYYNVEITDAYTVCSFEIDVSNHGITNNEVIDAITLITEKYMKERR